MERSEPDKLVDSMDFGELCNEFVCISSPLVEATARQLARDILELREGNRALGSFAVSVKYKVCHIVASQFGSLIKPRKEPSFLFYLFLTVLFCIRNLILN